MPFDLPTLESLLADSVFAGKLHYAPVTTSTNTDALVAAQAGAPHGSVFFADEQTAGRGRGDHTWHSAPGDGLYVSVLLRSSLPVARLPMLPLAAGLAAARAIRGTTGLAIDLRWPNDLLAGPRKLGGILAEATIRSQSPPHAVLGIGINVHHRDFPAGLATLATSLDLETGRRNSRQLLLVNLLKSLQTEIDALQLPDTSQALPLRLQQASSWISGRAVDVHGPQACSGITSGLDENGFLLVRTANGLVTVQTGGLRDASSESADLI